MRYQGFYFLVGHFALEFGSDLIGRFAKRQSFRLGEVVGEEDGMMIRRAVEIFDYIVLCFDGSKEVTWDDFGALVNKLVEGVLAILF